MEKEDFVNNPKHYKGYDSVVECLDITRHLPFDLGNAFKYIWRAGKKAPEKMQEDVEKAQFYINDFEMYMGTFIDYGMSEPPVPSVAAVCVFNTLVSSSIPSWKYELLRNIVYLDIGKVQENFTVTIEKLRKGVQLDA